MSDYQLIDPPTEEDWQILLHHFNTTRQRVVEDVKLLKQWFAQQPHLPQIDPGDLLVQGMLIRSKMSIERTKRTLDAYYTIRTALPEYFTNRDPLSRELQAAMDSFTMAVIPQRTKDGNRVCIVKLTETDPQTFSIRQFCKLAFMYRELFVTQIEKIHSEEIEILDCEYLTFTHVSQLTLAEIKKFDTCMMSGYKASVKAMHFINPPPAINMFMSILKSVLKNKLTSRLHVHATLASFHEHVDPELLPCDYGGKLKTYKELADAWRREVERNRDWFVQRELVEKVDESKRLEESVDTDTLFGTVGTFRNLTVD